MATMADWPEARAQLYSESTVYCSVGVLLNVIHILCCGVTIGARVIVLGGGEGKKHLCGFSAKLKVRGREKFTPSE